MSIDVKQLKSQINDICIEKGIEPEEVIQGIQRSIATAYRKDFGDRDANYTCEFDLNRGEYIIYKETKVVEEVINPGKEVAISEARLYNPEIEEGEVIKEKIEIKDVIDFGRIAAQIAKQVLLTSISAAKHTSILRQYTDRIGTLVNVEVDYPKKNGMLVKLDQAQAYISKEHLMPQDKLRSGQIIKVVILDIKEDEHGATKIVLSRTDPKFVEAVINQEIPEVESGSVKIHKIVREAGFRTKILVSSSDQDSEIDPVGAILGRKNVRLVNVMREINISMAEKIDIIEYQLDNQELMIMDALEPAQIDKVEIDNKIREVQVYCMSNEAFLAVGKKGVNIRLASKLLDYTININTTEVKEDFDSGDSIVVSSADEE